MSPTKKTTARAVTVALALTLVLALCISPAQASPVSDPTAGYIVVLKGAPGGAARIVADQAARLGFRVATVYRHALNGYAARLTVAQVAALARDARVAFVERDGVMRVQATQISPPWGLDRIDQQARPTDGAFTYTATGAGVTAYIIDTGIRYTHADFGGRATFGTDTVLGGLLGGGSTGGSDCNGHGTHVAGTVGGATHGVAKSVSLKAVRVLGCDGSGSTSWVIAGVDWVTGHHQAGQPAVANMSLGGGTSSSLDTAVRNSIADGVAYAVAAGNGNVLGQQQNACNSSPARVAEAMTISATDSTDRKASWANYGNCVDWFAPGVGIKSAWHSSDTATNTISGTSMASPHSAGVAAQYLQTNPGAAPATVRDALFALTTKGIVTSSSTTNNHLLYTNL